MFRKKCKLFTRRRISFFLFPLLCTSTIFILYQITIFMQIPKEYKLKAKGQSNLIRGIRSELVNFYRPNEGHTFTCIRSLEKIDFSKINDNYCDCLDGSDEPGTNACPNGRFFCKNQVDFKHFDRSVESAKVNDGICDCCDGSDEWDNNQVLHVERKAQKKADRYHVPCPKMC